MSDFATPLLRWAKSHARTGLPWQQSPANAYYVWLSEVMLQQTQVVTAVDYFKRFVGRFPNVSDLAKADIDDVLAYWAGLGYYARARHLHQSAQMIMQKHNGRVPDSFDALMALPGIGTSTAGAILSLAFNQAYAILDGNVKRVLARYHAIKTPLQQTKTTAELWRFAKKHVPKNNNALYTQAIMDLGAGICSKKQPQCYCCPVRVNCLARQQEVQHLYPLKQKAALKKRQNLAMFVFQNPCGDIYLYRRLNQGIWAGLWSLPEADKGTALIQTAKALRFKIIKKNSLTAFKHQLSHITFDIKALLVQTQGERNFFNPKQLPVAVPSAVKRILAQL